MKQITVNTFTPLYDELEDRIRLIVNYQNIQTRIELMITRSFILDLIPTLDEFISKYYKYEEIIQKKLNNKNIQKTDGTDLQLYQTKEQLLIKVDISLTNTTKQTQLVFYSKDSKVNAVFDKNMLKQFINQIKTAIPNIKWGISYNF